MKDMLNVLRIESGNASGACCICILDWHATPILVQTRVDIIVHTVVYILIHAVGLYEKPHIEFSTVHVRT